MKSSFKTYDTDDSADRIDEILDSPAGNYQEVDKIPSRDSLTFTNGYYVNCSCIYMDIIDSSSLPEKHKRPRLAKIYRSYISEAVALLNGDISCSEVNIHGDAVWAVFDGHSKTDIDYAFSACAKLASLVRILNCRLKKKDIDSIRVGIGADWGRALMIKAGYKGSGINEVVWMGDVVNTAANMCKTAKTLSQWSEARTCVSSTFYSNLDNKNKELLTHNAFMGYAYGDVINLDMDAWWEKNCKSS